MVGLLPLHHLGPKNLSPARMALRGHFDQTLDAKNRLNVPAKLRAGFSDGLVLMKSHDAPCIAIFTPAGLRLLQRQLPFEAEPAEPRVPEDHALPRGQLVRHGTRRGGRVTLNGVLLAHAGIEKDVVLIGAQDRLELWSRETWDQQERRAAGRDRRDRTRP